MLTSNKKRRQCSVYKANALSKPVGEKDRFLVYQDIRGGKYKPETDHILEKHKVRLRSNFADNVKAPYQATKKRYCSAVTFAGVVNRNTGEFVTGGLVTLDIDENTKKELNKILQDIKMGRVPFIEAAAGSVSHPYTGAFWANAKVEMPNSIGMIQSRIMDFFDFHGKDLVTIHKLLYKYYHAYITNFFAELGINIGSSSDFTRIRYLTHDADIYIKENVKKITLQQLLKAGKKLRKQYKKGKGKPSSKQIEINANLREIAIKCKSKNPFKIAEYVALNAVGSFASGRRHHFHNCMAICLNLFGIGQETAFKHITTKFVREDTPTNAVSYPYQTYSESHGIWADLIADDKVKAAHSFVLEEGQFMSDYSDDILNILKEKLETEATPHLDILGGTSIGKSYATANFLAPKLAEMTGCKSIIILPLNALTLKQAISYGLKYVTGERLKQSDGKAYLKEIWENETVIFCNHDSFARLAELADDNAQLLNVFIDESHTLTNYFDFRKKVLTTFMATVNKIARSVILYSGTPKPYFSALGYERIEFIKKSRPIINVDIRLTRASENKRTTALRHIKNADFSNGKILLIKIQSKSDLKCLRKTLLTQGFTKDEIVLIASEKAIKKSVAYKDILNASKHKDSFSELVKVVLTTSAINCGFDIYQNRPIEMVNIEPSRSIDAEALIQFADRWRTTAEKNLVTYHTVEKELKSYFFNPLHYFKKECAKAEKQAAFFTEGRRSGIEFRDEKLYELGSSLNTAQSSFYWNDEAKKFDVNRLKIMAETEAKVRKSTGIEKLKSILFGEFDYFKEMTDNTKPQPTADIKSALEMLDDQKAKDKVEKQQQHQRLFNLLESDFENVCGAVWHLSDNTQLKTKIRKSLSAKTKDDSLNFANTHYILFYEYLSDVERALTRIFKLEIYGLNKKQTLPTVIFQIDNDNGLMKLSHTNKFNEFYNKMIILLGFELRNMEKDYDKPLLSYMQLKDIEQHQRVGATLMNFIVEREQAGIQPKDSIMFTEKDLCKVVRKHKRGLSKQQCLKLINCLFKTERKKTHIFLHRTCSLETLLNEYNLDIFKLAKKVRNLLIDRGYRE